MQKSRLAQRKLGVKPHTKPKKRNYINVIFAALVLLAAFTVLFFILSPKSWSGKEKFSTVNETDSGDILVQILDPFNSSVTEITIPASTEVTAANQLGTWKLGSIMKLGIDKNLSSDFLKNTVIKSFNFPIDSSQNLSLLDNLRIKFYLFTIGNTAKLSVNLKDTNYISRKQLTDGSIGYEITGNIPPKVESYFTENFLNIDQNIVINNQTGSVSAGIMAGKALQVLGTNVASIKNLDKKDFDCKVIGNENILVQKIAKILGCEFNLSKPANNFDIEVDLGIKFKNKF